MGIRIERFTDKPEVVAAFTCSICMDVVLDPVATSCCSESFCKSCLTSWFKVRAVCPHCYTATNSVMPIHRQVQGLYFNLSMKCVAQKCKEALTPANYIAHDKSCVFIPFKCKICGFKSNIGQKDGHNCLNWLVDERNKLVASVNKWQTDPRIRTKVQGQLLDGMTFDLHEVVETKIKIAEDKVKIEEDKIKIEEKKSKWLKFALVFVVMLILFLLIFFSHKIIRYKIQIKHLKFYETLYNNTLTKLFKVHNVTEPTM